MRVHPGEIGRPAVALGKYDCKPTLTDRQMMDFCRNGYLILEGVVSDEGQTAGPSSS